MTDSTETIAPPPVAAPALESAIDATHAASPAAECSTSTIESLLGIDLSGAETGVVRAIDLLLEMQAEDLDRAFPNPALRERMAALTWWLGIGDSAPDMDVVAWLKKSGFETAYQAEADDEDLPAPPRSVPATDADPIDTARPVYRIGGAW